MTTDPEELAKEIYWAAYDGAYGEHPHKLDRNTAWQRTSEEHRRFARHQAARALAYFQRVMS